MRYFRYPYMNTGPSREVKEAFEKFLKNRGYQAVPHTVESSDWLFNAIYAKAKLKGDTATMKLVSDEYVAQTARMFDYFESKAQQLFERPVPHIYLCHVNDLQADSFGKLAAVLKAKAMPSFHWKRCLKMRYTVWRKIMSGSMALPGCTAGMYMNQWRRFYNRSPRWTRIFTSCIRVMSRAIFALPKAKLIISGLFILLAVLCGCGPAVYTKVYQEQEPIPPSEAVVVQDKHTEMYSGAVLLGTIRVEDTGYTIGCTLPQVLKKAVVEVRKMGGNVVRVVQVYPPGNGSS